MCSLEKIDEERQIMLRLLRRVEDDAASLEADKKEAEQFLAKMQKSRGSLSLNVTVD